MNPLASPFVPRKIRIDIPIENLDDFHRNSKTVCQCMSTRCDCIVDCSIYVFSIAIYNHTITVWDEVHQRFFYLEGDLSLREVLGYLGYFGNDIVHKPFGLFGDGGDTNECILDDSLKVIEPTQVALQ